MNYRVIAVTPDGEVENIGCATWTDVENTVVQVVRKASHQMITDVNIIVLDMR